MKCNIKSDQKNVNIIYENRNNNVKFALKMNIFTFAYQSLEDELEIIALFFDYRN